jgi:acetyl esterase/lipase
MKQALPFVVCILLLTGFAARAQNPQDVAVDIDVVYGHSDGVDLKMDLAHPAATDAPAPAIVCIHGGAWRSGNKRDYQQHIRFLASMGYVAAAVEYRFAPAHSWPAQIQDVKCAVRYLRAHARELNIDPSRIGALGDSAGAHLALLLGLMDPSDGFDNAGGNDGQSSKVQAVVNFSGPTNLASWRIAPEAEAEFLALHGRDSDGILADFLGTADRSSPVMAEASPVTYVGEDDPPILTFHGVDDAIVSVEQAQLLHAALDKAGVPQTLTIIEGAGHAFAPEQLLNATLQAQAFLERTLKGIPEADVSSEPPISK